MTKKEYRKKYYEQIVVLFVAETITAIVGMTTMAILKSNTVPMLIVAGATLVLTLVYTYGFCKVASNFNKNVVHTEAQNG